MPYGTCQVVSEPGDSTSATHLSPAPPLPPGSIHHSHLDSSMVAHLLGVYGSEVGNLIGYSQANDNALERITPGAPDPGRRSTTLSAKNGP